MSDFPKYRKSTSRLKLSHNELPFSVEGTQNTLCFENSQRFLRVTQACSRWGLQPGLYCLSWAALGLCRPVSPVPRKPGSGDEPHRFNTGLESMSVKWKPDSLSFLYRSISSIQTPTVFPARKEEETALSRSLHHLKPFHGLDSCCLLIMGQTPQHEVCCINRPRNNPAIVWRKLGHLGLSTSTSIIPVGCHDLELL